MFARVTKSQEIDEKIRDLTQIIEAQHLGCEREYLEDVLRRTSWNFAAAARLLGIQRTYLHQKAAALGIERPRR
jgi:transcriptional regulator with GAF, ATPase, and Fis domain